MKIAMDGKTVEARLTTENPCSSYGLPVLEVNGTAYGTGDLLPLRIVKATREEREALSAAGYVVAEAEA